MREEHRGTADKAVQDPRLLRLQAERAAEALRNTVVASAAWAAAIALICSDLIGLFGHVPYPRALMFVFVVGAASIGSHVMLTRFEMAQRELETGRLVAPLGPEGPRIQGYTFNLLKARADLPKIRSFQDWLFAELEKGGAA